MHPRSGHGERIIWRADDSVAEGALSSAQTIGVELLDEIDPAKSCVYWIAYGIAPDAPWLFPGSAPHNGRNSDGAVGYSAPCPSLTGQQCFGWRVMALDVVPNSRTAFLGRRLRLRSPDTSLQRAISGLNTRRPAPDSSGCGEGIDKRFLSLASQR
jgi:hypothetical protein